MRAKCAFVVSLALVAFTTMAKGQQRASSTPQEPSTRHIIEVAAPSSVFDPLRPSVATVQANLPTHRPNDPWFTPAYDEAVGNESAALWEVDQNPPTATKVVFVLDTGMKFSHPDLNARFLASESFDLIGDTVTNPHGYFMAYAGFAVTNNGSGNASTGGYTNTVQFASARFLDNTGNGSITNEVTAIQRIVAAKQRGVPVVAVSMSFGSIGVSSREQDAVKLLTDNGIVVFASAGKPTPGQNDFCPACYSASNPLVIPTGELNDAGTGPDQSWTWGDIAAPRTFTAADDPNNPASSGTVGGVSVTAPQAAGAFVLMCSMFANLNPVQAASRFRYAASATPITSFKYGRLNMYIAVTKRPFLVTKQDSQTDAVALDSNFMAGPFPRSQSVLGSPVQPTRISLFAYNVTLTPGEPFSAVQVSWRDSQGKTGTFSVEYVGTISDAAFLSQVIAVLPDTIAPGNVSITMTFHGQTTDPLNIAVR